MDFGHYSDETIALAVDLVNDYGTEPRVAEGGADAPFPPLEDLVARLGPAGGDADGGDASELDAVRALADRLFTVFAAEDDESAVATLNDVLAEAGAQPRISGHDGQGWHLHYDANAAALVPRLAATTAMALAAVVCEHGRARLGACGGRSCRDVYVDTSRNGSRRYCSDTCSNRANVAAFRARRSTSGDADA